MHNHNIIIQQSISLLNKSISKYRKIVVITQQSIINQCHIQNLIIHPNILYHNCAENEQCKSIDELKLSLDFLIDNKVNKDTLLVGVGGGTVTDLTGFIATIYMRGLDHYFVPTTLLGMVDASIGGKTAINYKLNRNIIGTFKEPKKIFINIDFISSLEQCEIINGFAEIIKYALILDKNLFHIINNNFEDLYNQKDLNQFREIINICIQHKIKIINQDFKDEGIRKILNFGHTVAHALESCSNFKISHGISVLLGMKVALYISNDRGMLSNDEYFKAQELINKFNIKPVFNFNFDKVGNFLDFDKKLSNNKINYILLKKIGVAYIDNNFSKNIILQAMKVIK